MICDEFGKVLSTGKAGAWLFAFFHLCAFLLCPSVCQFCLESLDSLLARTLNETLISLAEPTVTNLGCIVFFLVTSENPRFSKYFVTVIALVKLVTMPPLMQFQILQRISLPFTRWTFIIIFLILNLTYYGQTIYKKHRKVTVARRQYFPRFLPGRGWESPSDSLSRGASRPGLGAEQVWSFAPLPAECRATRNASRLLTLSKFLGTARQSLRYCIRQ